MIAEPQKDRAGVIGAGSVGNDGEGNPRHSVHLGGKGNLSQSLRQVPQAVKPWGKRGNFSG